MKRFLLFLFVLLILPSMFAQNSDVKTVLYFLPFFGDEYNSCEKRIYSPTRIDNEPIFSLVSYWEGAQMAFNEYEKSQHRIDVIVKDITYDNDKLIQIMKNEELMNRVDLIIGPFFASQFEIAAEYAKKYQIPIVNPFTSKQDILEDNEFVYKVQSSTESVAEIVKQRWMIDKEDEREILFWTEKDADIQAMQRCETFFSRMNIPYEFMYEGDKLSLKNRLSNNKRQIVMAFLPSETAAIARIRNLGVENLFPNTVFIIPEEWLNIGALEVDYLNKLNVHFFSDYYVNMDDDKTLVFISDFIEKYNTPPDVKRFSFQGYDITKYFVELMLHDFDASQVQFTPIAMKFNFVKNENGGYENHGLFLLQLKDYKIQLAD